ncbi:MAG: NAD(P)/FAD-dependent oxidoreductase [Bacteroidia bacterium]|nr:NAD(P)/FAD-dependent oxidoreductase [Bacteroidia bacterium]
MQANINKTNLKRIVIIGGGFGGLKLARELSSSNFQVVLIDKNNYHQFQPLFYQVATAGLEPSAISFPFRKVFQNASNVHVRVAEVSRIDAAANRIQTSIGEIEYDYLILAIGADTNFFGNQNMMKYAMPMKSVSEALSIRNTILENYEKALVTTDEQEKQALMNIVIVGGGPTGVEVAGTLAEMKKTVLPKDYPELDFSLMQVHLLEGSGRVLASMSEIASEKAKQYLIDLGVDVSLNARVTDYDGNTVTLTDSPAIHTRTLVWAAGVTGNKIEGLTPEVISRGNRILVDKTNKVNGYSNIFAIGDIAFMKDEAYPNGHPQVAQVAIQQGELLAKNLKALSVGKTMKEFKYKDLGSMATVGRNKAVVDLPKIKFQGFFAWMVWMFIHLMSIVGIKNRLLIFINWAWNYITYDQSLRLIIKSKTKQ